MNYFVKTFLKKELLFPAIGTLGIFCIILGFLAFRHWQKTARSPKTLLSCITSSHGRYMTEAFCFERVVGELMKTYPAKELLGYIAAPSTPKIVQVSGHTIAHFIGKQLFLKTGSVEASLEQCIPDSQYGCLHGVIGAAVVREVNGSSTEETDLAHANSATLERVAEKYCARDDLQLCHAVGHILFQTFSDYTKTLETCDHVSIKDVSRKEMCFRGAFMESAGPATSLSPSIRPLDSDLTYRGVCDQISSPYQHACFRYLPKIQRIIFEREGIYAASKRIAIAKNICVEFIGTPRADCIESIGLNAEGTFGGENPLHIQSFCEQFTAGADRQACVLGVAGSFIKTFDYNGGVRYCHAMLDSVMGDFCFHVFFQITEQISMGSEMKTICNKESTSSTCNQKLREYMTIKPTLPNYSLGLYGGRG